jgi:hypothetical protein
MLPTTGYLCSITASHCVRSSRRLRFSRSVLVLTHQPSTKCTHVARSMFSCARFFSAFVTKNCPRLRAPLTSTARRRSRAERRDSRAAEQQLDQPLAAYQWLDQPACCALWYSWPRSLRLERYAPTIVRRSLDGHRMEIAMMAVRVLSTRDAPTVPIAPTAASAWRLLLRRQGRQKRLHAHPCWTWFWFSMRVGRWAQRHTP